MPTLVLPSSSPRASGPLRSWCREHRGGAVAALAFAVAAFALAACQGAGVDAPVDGWSEAQLAQVFDLSELGRVLAVAPEGDGLLLDGRPLPPEAMAAFPHLTMGRTTNLLRFAGDALEAMAPEAREFVLRAAPGELRARLQDYGVGLADLRAAWGDDGELGLAGLVAVAAELDRSAVRATAAIAGTRGTTAGARLLADLGVTR